MTRKEQILQAARDYVSRVTFSSPSDVIHFGNGAKWADEHPNLESLWHDASEEPICGKRLLLLHTNSVVSIFEYTGKSSWSMLVSCGICQYAYISELLPKGGTK